MLMLISDILKLLQRSKNILLISFNNVVSFSPKMARIFHHQLAQLENKKIVYG